MRKLGKFFIAVALMSYLFGDGCFIAASDALFSDPGTVVVQ